MAQKAHEFGGSWTDKKLENLKKYLSAYTKIFTTNPRAKFYKTIYIDAFAGTGYRKGKDDEADLLLLPFFDEIEVQEFYDGSAKIALQNSPRFNKYIFIEQEKERIESLNELKSEFPALVKDILIQNEDANKYLLKICKKVDWKKFRAVVFLDPYGMQVEWDTIKALATTKAIDVWILFPLGVAVNRLLRKNGVINSKIKERLDKIFGSNDWVSEFYIEEEMESLFGAEQRIKKIGDFNKISKYFTRRLKTIFAGVADNPLPLFNSRNNPLYLLCFAAANERGAKAALNIAKFILKQ
jgi:three-Cys-motif partner protein